MKSPLPLDLTPDQDACARARAAYWTDNAAALVADHVAAEGAGLCMIDRQREGYCLMVEASLRALESVLGQAWVRDYLRELAT